MESDNQQIPPPPYTHAHHYIDGNICCSSRLKRCKVLTVGVYDLLHIGHVNLFRRAKQLGDFLLVAVQTNQAVTVYKPNASVVNSTEERMFMVSSICYVDEVCTYQNVSDIVQQVEFDVFAVGPDQCHKGFQDAFEFCRQHGKQVVVLPRTEGVSSSWIKEKIKSL